MSIAHLLSIDADAAEAGALERLPGTQCPLNLGELCPRPALAERARPSAAGQLVAWVGDDELDSDRQLHLHPTPRPVVEQQYIHRE